MLEQFPLKLVDRMDTSGIQTFQEGTKEDSQTQSVTKTHGHYRDYTYKNHLVRNIQYKHLSSPIKILDIKNCICDTFLI